MKRPSAMLYLIEILHQTTTINAKRDWKYRCILLKFYIKPQLIMSLSSILVLYLIEILHQTTTEVI